MSQLVYCKISQHDIRLIPMCIITGLALSCKFDKLSNKIKAYCNSAYGNLFLEMELLCLRD